MLINFCILVNHIRAVAFIWKTKYRIILCEELPDVIHKDMIYLSGKPDNLCYMAMLCPCGCGETIELNLIQSSHPCWQITWNFNGTISLSPSIRRIRRCKSHFFLRNGKVIWCKD